MTMRVTRIGDAEPFQPEGHNGVGPVRLQGGESTPTTDFTVALSHYLPGGAAELAPQPSETVYVIVSGELVMSAEGREAVLGVFDSVHFTPGTVRSVENRTNLPASMLVIRATS
ncbi:cupin domain-containing protein [Diaminobutyricibacter sp. McL0618]|uniref:cupin domain-containing protein n=1 Tax=Leifsonia sp. McL0618 TaxID=3415677 RepID=UPI003CED5C2A